MKKRWLFVTLLVGILAIGISGGAVLALGDGTSGDSPSKNLVSRVAAILGIEEAQVQDAFDQAAKEMQDEALQQRLDRLVEQGRLTQEQADEYQQWYQSRPESLSPGFQFHGFGGRGFFRGGIWSGLGRHGVRFFHGASPTSTPESSEATSL